MFAASTNIRLLGSCERIHAHTRSIGVSSVAYVGRNNCFVFVGTFNALALYQPALWSTKTTCVSSPACWAIISILALRRNQLPPTINLNEPGEGCDLDYIPNTARQVENTRHTMSNSFGFGGHNVSLVFGKA